MKKMKGMMLSLVGSKGSLMEKDSFCRVWVVEVCPRVIRRIGPAQTHLCHHLNIKFKIIFSRSIATLKKKLSVTLVLCVPVIS